jgi:Xaa-Pro dipeptidase
MELSALDQREHLDRLLAAMADESIDALLLGRPANTRWITGAEALWLSGTRPFAPGCVVMREPLAVHLLSTTDDGVPPEVVPFDHLFPMSWNPGTLMGALAVIPGLPAARRVGVDSMNPLMAQLLGATLPDAQFVDGEALLRRLRRVKSEADLAGLRAALELADECLDTVVAALRPGVTERALVGVFDECMAQAGTTTPAFEGSFVVVRPGGGSRTLVSDRTVADGDVVHLRAGVLRDGWEGARARTAVCGTGVVAPPDALDDAVARCIAGGRVGDVRARGVTVDGVGVGHEELHDDDVLEPGMVAVVEVLVDDVLGSETIVVTPAGPEALIAA